MRREIRFVRPAGTWGRFLMLSAILLLSACGVSDATGPTPKVAEEPVAPAGQARLRVVHADDELPDLDVFIDGARVLAGLVNATASDYFAIQAGRQSVDIRAGGLGSDAFSTFFAGATDYTLLPCCAFFPASTLLTDDNSFPLAGHAKIRVVNFARTSADVYVTASGADMPALNLKIALNHQAASSYLEVPAGEYQLRVTPPNNALVVIANGTLTLGDGQVRTMVAVNTREGGQGRLLVLSDLN